MFLNLIRMEDSKLCRLCALNKTIFIGIYDDEGHKLCIESRINKYLQIELYAKDPLPKSICIECCNKLDQCSDFIESSVTAQITLQRMYPVEDESDKFKEETITELLPVPHVSQSYSDEEIKPDVFDEIIEEDAEEEEEEEEDEDDDEEEIEGEEEDEDCDLVNDNLENNCHDVGNNENSPGFVECLLSEKDGQNHASKRKRTMPMRCYSTVSAKAKKKSNINTKRDRKSMKGGSDSETDEILKDKLWDEYLWICSDCTEEFTNVQDLRNHHSTFHNQAPRYTCAQCTKVYAQYNNFLGHVKRHRNQLKYNCEECGKSFSNKKVLDSHLTTHSDSRPYICSECGKAFRQQSALYIHSRCHLPEEVKNKYACDQCSKRFSTKPNLVTHKRIHTGIRNFTCDQCGKSFIQKGNLDAHLLTHSQDKPFNCDLCNKGFKTAMQLRKHHTVHTGAKPHQCDVCGRTFRERGTLKEHHRIHTGAMPFTCEFCGKAFRFKGILTTHRRQHTGERPYSCLECQHHFTNWPNYNKHMKRRHGINTSRTTRVKQQQHHHHQQQQQHQQPQQLPPPVPLVEQPPLYEDSIPPEDLSDRSGHFYNHTQIMAPTMSTYMSPHPNTMLSFYNLTQIQTSHLQSTHLQTLDQTNGAIDMLQHR
uniref:Protein krueppel n=1 Tax=Clastoptera arizonana TaxID=38151 RepID=A0A1B6CRP7_9HEMI